ncbi:MULTISPECIES: phage baseplate assembly protein V [unclassified Microcoleus]|uniref:phage baseplate assembly protein V n=1 Tax=unclassified Microcoleus TaxID=2642155 RepID=UPI002FD5BE12
MGNNLLSYLQDANQESDRFYGVTVGIVTNNKDEEGLGRVRVKFPCLSETDESYWARVLTPMAGKQRGIYFLPEVDDEVLVAFDRGDISSPYILGGLWNGQDKPPESNTDGKNNLRVIKSRSGHQIILDDTENAEKITICDGTGKNQIVIDSKNNAISIEGEKDISIKAKGKISLESSDGDISIKCKNLAIQTQQNCEIKANSKVEVKANSNCNIQANAGMALKCMAGVKINDGALEVI